MAKIKNPWHEADTLVFKKKKKKKVVDNDPGRIIGCVPMVMAVMLAEFPNFQILWWDVQLELHEGTSMRWILVNDNGKKQIEVKTERLSCNGRSQGFTGPGEVTGVEEEGRNAVAMQEVVCIMEGKTSIQTMTTV